MNYRKLKYVKVLCYIILVVLAILTGLLVIKIQREKQKMPEIKYEDNILHTDKADVEYYYYSDMKLVSIYVYMEEQHDFMWVGSNYGNQMSSAIYDEDIGAYMISMPITQTGKSTIILRAINSDIEYLILDVTYNIEEDVVELSARS